MAQVVEWDCDSETLPAVAERMRETITDLHKRAIPVTEAQVTKDNVPTLPIGVVAPLRQTFAKKGNYTYTIQEDFVIEIWLEPAREKTKDGGESPFWSYYAYNKFRNKMMVAFANWRTPQNGGLEFLSMDVESNFLATVLTFRLRATYDVCFDDGEDEPPANITFQLCQPVAACLPEPEQEKDPCPVST